MTKELQKAMTQLANKKPHTQHMIKLGEESTELATEVFKCIGANFQNGNRFVLEEMADVLNTIDIYLESIGVSKDELDSYRLAQVKKHLK